MINITSNLDQFSLIPVSYGMDVKMEFTGILEFRNKMGLDIEVKGVAIGSVEIDFGQTSVDYEISVGEVIKQYIIKDEPEWFNNGLVTDGLEHVVLKPYVKQRTSTSTWTDKIYGAVKEFYVVRGVHMDYYVSNDLTPKISRGSMVFNNSPGSYTVEATLDSWKYLYFYIEGSRFTYKKLSGVNTFYALDSSGVEQEVGHLNIDIDGKSLDSIYAYIKASLPSTNDYTRSVLAFQTVEYNRDTDEPIGNQEDWSITIKHKCNNEWDFQLDLLYIDSSFNWGSMPFFTKNENSFNRAVNTVEGYDYSKADYNLKVRRTYKLKSDYMPKSEATEAMLLGITPEVKVMMAGQDDAIDARLLTKSISVQSPKNIDMVQIEIEIELSDKVITP